jgi:hypothetical protein
MKAMNSKRAFLGSVVGAAVISLLRAMGGA